MPRSTTIAIRRARSFRGIAAGLALLLLASVGAAVGAPAAFAADEPTLTVSKSVDAAAALSPGDEFTYEVVTGCFDFDCTDVVLGDVLPAAFDGFEVVDAPSVSPSSLATVATSGFGATVSSSATITATATTALPDVAAGAVGLAAGSSFTVRYTLRAPLDLTPAWEHNGLALTNTATASASNAVTATATADVTVDIAASVDVAVGVAWAPAAQQFAAGTESLVTLTTRNTSNVPAELLTVGGPDAADGSATLATGNPFRVVDFAGFGDVTLPQGATEVRVSAYVLDGGTWSWQEGVFGAAAVLPGGVTPAEVAGLRFDFRGPDGAAVLAAGGAAGAVELRVQQRTADRIDPSILHLTGASTSFPVEATVVVPGEDSVSATASAPYSIGPLTVAVGAEKTISPTSIPAGGVAVATVIGHNESNGPVSSLTIADRDFFVDGVLFDGFTEAIQWPAGATAAEVLWLWDGGSVSLPFANGATPVAPVGEDVTGFELVFTGVIAESASASARFGITTTGDFVPEGTASIPLTNTVDVDAVNDAGSADASDSADVSVYFPRIDITTAKSVSPSGPVASNGGRVAVELPTSTSGASQFVRPDTIVVTDALTAEPDDFWNAFNPVSILPMQVPLGATLVVEYSTATDPEAGAWTTLVSDLDSSSARMFSHTIPTALVPTITALRFTFDNPGLFGQGTEVIPAIGFAARAELRDGSGPVAPIPTTGVGTPVTYTNASFAGATGMAGTTPVASPIDTAEAPAQVVGVAGDGTVFADKTWIGAGDVISLTSQSGETATSRLAWGVAAPGAASVVISDPAPGSEAHPEDTIFQALDLTRVRSVTFAQDPLLRWDTVSAVELFRDGAWTPVPAPAGSWMSASGFKGYTLTAPERAAVTGVRITVVENTAARTASMDATRAEPGSGVASGTASADRRFELDWVLRNTVRVIEDDVRWVAGTTLFNTADEGLVRNVMGVTVTPQVGTPSTATADADVNLLDVPPLVDVTIDRSASSLVVPNPGDVPVGGYPTVDFTVTAENTAVSRASYLRVTAMGPCDGVVDCVTPADGFDADVFAGHSYSSANTFERVTLTSLAFTIPAAEASKDHSIVTLWLRAADGTLSSTQLTITQAEALDAAALEEVVGVSVTYQAASPETDGGSIVNGSEYRMTLGTVLRETMRSDPDTYVTTGTDIEAVTVAQSYDPILRPSATPYAADTTPVQLLAGALDTTATKTITPAVLLERDRDSDVRVRLQGTDGAATASADTVTLTDETPGFWDAVTLVSLGAVTLPAGADRVRVDVLVDGAWVLGTPGAVAALPAAELDEVTGIRLVFDRADGGLLSTTAVPADWTTAAEFTVMVRDTFRSGGDVAFPANLENELVVESSRDDGVYASVSADDPATLQLSLGSFSMDVVKSTPDNQHTVDPASSGLWSLEFTNTGTGFLTVDRLVDELPSHLAYDGIEPSYATSAGGILSTDVTLTESGDDLVFTWPGDADRMAPGETFTITFSASLQLGAPAPTTNRFVVAVAQTLAACTNASGNGQGTLSGLEVTECGTSNFVQPRTGSNIRTDKGVAGEIDGTLVSGAINTSNPARDCIADPAGFSFFPCAAQTVVGATDEWLLRTVNSGTEPVTSLTIVDPLPMPGDRMLTGGAQRGTTWQPLFDANNGLELDAPAGSTLTWQVTTDAAACVGTGAGSAWQGDPTCAVNSWTDSTAYAGDWAEVTAVRAVVDFTGTAASGLQPGEIASVLYRTINVPVSAEAPLGAPVAPSVDAEFAWNHFGAQASFANGDVRTWAPTKAGVTLASGSLEVIKEVTGAAAAFAPGTFGADVTCVTAGIETVSTVTLDAANGLRARIDGVPLGSECTVVEHGVLGDYDETDRTGSGTTVAILTPGGVADAVPTAQTVVLGNDYDFGSLRITKTEDRATAQIGERVTYTVLLENTGARTAYNLEVVDDLPDAATVVSVEPVGTLADGAITWTVDELAAGASVAYTVVVTFDAAGPQFNRATVTTPPGPWTPLETVRPCADDPEWACTNVDVSAPGLAGLPFLGADSIGAVLLIIVLPGLGGTLVGVAVVRRRTV
jgi:uncharacterized repeat protein (TIGR01451 family)